MQGHNQSSNTECHCPCDDYDVNWMITMVKIIGMNRMISTIRIIANLINHPILKIIAEGENTHLVDHVKLPSSETKNNSSLHDFLQKSPGSQKQKF